MNRLQFSSKCLAVFAHLIYVIPESQIRSIGIGKSGVPGYRIDIPRRDFCWASVCIWG